MFRGSAIKHLFFDLDHTLWDFERNSDEALDDLYTLFNIENLGVPNLHVFKIRYKEINAAMWDQYHKGIITKEILREHRFSETLRSFGVQPDKIPDGMWEQYLRICPKKNHLMPGAIETLEYMKEKYSLSIITNGFKEVQHFKLKHAGLTPYFNHVIISEETGFQKPHRGIFEHALQLVGGKPEEALMIGDNLETDIGGAMQSDWEAIWYNPYKNPAPVWIRRQIIALPELTYLL